MTQDLVVISFERDIPLLDVFVKSVDKFVSENLFENFWLVITDDTPTDKFQCIESSKFSWKVVYAKDMFTVLNFKDRGDAGYINQQIAKIKIAELIESDWYWLFDSKNFIVQNIDSTVLYENNRAKIIRSFSTENWNVGYRKLQDIFDIELETPILNVTPYPLHTPSVKSMLTEYQNFPVLFYELYDKHKICEFFFYNFYIFKENMFDQLYVSTKKYVIVIYPDDLNDSGHQPEFLKSLLLQKEFWCSGIHYTAINVMTDKQKENWADFLIWLKFFNDRHTTYNWFQQVIDYHKN